MGNGAVAVKAAVADAVAVSVNRVKPDRRCACKLSHVAGVAVKSVGFRGVVGVVVMVILVSVVLISYGMLRLCWCWW